MARIANQVDLNLFLNQDLSKEEMNRRLSLLAQQVHDTLEALINEVDDNG